MRYATLADVEAGFRTLEEDEQRRAVRLQLGQRIQQLHVLDALLRDAVRKPALCFPREHHALPFFRYS